MIFPSLGLTASQSDARSDAAAVVGIGWGGGLKPSPSAARKQLTHFTTRTTPLPCTENDVWGSEGETFAIGSTPTMNNANTLY